MRSSSTAVAMSCCSPPTARITTGYTEALQAVNTVPGFAQFMNQNYGLSVGDLASHYLNPSISLQTLQNQYNASAVAGATGQVGMGQLDQAQAESVAHFLANSNTSGLGGNGAVNLGQVEAGLTSSLTGVGASAAQLNPYTAGTSRAGEQNLSENTLLGAALENNASDIQTVQTAVGSRTAGSKGGGGFATNAQGAEGVGFASE